MWLDCIFMDMATLVREWMNTETKYDDAYVYIQLWIEVAVQRG